MYSLKLSLPLKLYEKSVHQQQRSVRVSPHLIIKLFDLLALFLLYLSSSSINLYEHIVSIQKLLYRVCVEVYWMRQGTTHTHTRFAYFHECARMCLTNETVAEQIAITVRQL